MIKAAYSLLFIIYFACTNLFAQDKEVWKIGENDNSAQGMALSPDQFKRFVEYDFGYEDRFFLIGQADASKEWPYVLPGPRNGWGGTGNTSGIRSHILNIYFDIEKKPATGNWQLMVDVLETDSAYAPYLKIMVNGKSWKYKLERGNSGKNPEGTFDRAKEQLIKVDLPANLIRMGNNEVMLTSLEGGWLVFDQIKMSGPTGVTLAAPGEALVKNVAAADYETQSDGKRFQPLLIDLVHLQNKPTLEVKLDGKTILNQRIEKGEYVFEAPMPAVAQSKQSKYQVLLNNKLVREGEVTQEKKTIKTPAGYVNTMMGVGHSRWMIAPGPWMPFGMVKLSPDNQNNGWQAGYDPTFESIGTFSHIHEWTMAGLGTFPVAGPLKIKPGDQGHEGNGYRSKIDRSTEEAPLGYYKVDLADYNITAELTSTTRASFQRYNYHNNAVGRIMVDLKIPAEYSYVIKAIQLNKVNDRRIEGYSHQLSENVWSRDASQEYTVHFVMEFDKPIKEYGVWLNDEVKKNSNLSAGSAEDAGIYLEFDTKTEKAVQVRTGISYVSIESAALNLKTEISDPFGWSFESVKNNQLKLWNDLLGRVQITSNDQREKRTVLYQHVPVAGKQKYLQ